MAPPLLAAPFKVKDKGPPFLSGQTEKPLIIFHISRSENRFQVSGFMFQAEARYWHLKRDASVKSQKNPFTIISDEPSEIRNPGNP
jgi:hypothetical protein